MELISQIVLGATVCACVIAVIYSVKGLLLTPVIRRENADVFAVVRIRKDAEGLEQVMRGLIWLKDSGKTDMAVVIAADDATPQAILRAERLAARCGGVLCAPAEIDKVTEELRWTKPDTQP